MSSSFDQFATKKKSNKDIMHVLKERFSLGMDEMSKNVSHVFGSNESDQKHQITQELNDREQVLKTKRSFTG